MFYKNVVTLNEHLTSRHSQSFCDVGIDMFTENMPVNCYIEQQKFAACRWQEVVQDKKHKFYGKPTTISIFRFNTKHNRD
jgi:hypothetical protein